MILSITSSLPTFRSLTFKSGLNVLLADVTKTSTDRQTRNSSGKTTVVEIISFLLGADAGRKSLFFHEKLTAHSFRGRLTLRGLTVEVERRCGVDSRTIRVSQELPALAGLAGRYEIAKGMATMTLGEWNDLLGWALFGLPAVRAGSDLESKSSPSSRAMLGYFVRRHLSGGFNRFWEHTTKQPPWGPQVNLSYLIGLDWKISRGFQDVRDKREHAQTLRKAIADGDLGRLFRPAAEIRPDLARTRERRARLQQALQGFTIHENHRELSDEAARLKRTINEASLRLVILKGEEEHLQSLLMTETAPVHTDVQRMYEQAGVSLPGVSLRRYDDVRAFQESIAQNRRGYLEAELTDVRTKIAETDLLIGDADKRRSGILADLDGKGALDDFKRLQEEVGSLASQESTLQQVLDIAEAVEASRSEIKLKEGELEQALLRDLQAKSDVTAAALLKVDHAIARLYDDRKGNLLIAGKGKSGLQFDMKITGDGNLGGVDMMKTFCFDMMLLETRREIMPDGIDFLVHDSHLFDSVDSRQVRSSVLYGQERSAATASQYIVLMNSDMFAAAGLDRIESVRDAILSVQLNDQPNGGVLGFRLD